MSNIPPTAVNAFGRDLLDNASRGDMTTSLIGSGCGSGSLLSNGDEFPLSLLGNGGNSSSVDVGRDDGVNDVRSTLTELRVESKKIKKNISKNNNYNRYKNEKLPLGVGGSSEKERVEDSEKESLSS